MSFALSTFNSLLNSRDLLCCTTCKARNDLSLQEVTFHLRLPQRQFYKLSIYARDRLTSQKHEHLVPDADGLFQYSFEKVCVVLRRFNETASYST